MPFLIHPRDLAERRARCKPLLDRLSRIGTEPVHACHSCGSSERAILAMRDRYGLNLPTALCLHCGLVYLAARFTIDGYRRFYESGLFEEVTGAFNDSLAVSRRDREAEQREYAASLIAILEDFVAIHPGRRLLDIGGNTGVIAAQVARHFKLRGAVIDPQCDEAELEHRFYLEARAVSLEQWTTSKKFDLILLCRTVEHLYDLRGSLLKLRSLLAEGGKLVCDVIDFAEACKYEGAPEATTKADHCQWLAHHSAPFTFARAGFSVLQAVLPRPYQAFYILEAAPPKLSAMFPRDAAAESLRSMRDVEAEWLASPGRGFGARQGIRRALRRRLRRAVQRCLEWSAGYAPVFRSEKFI